MCISDGKKEILFKCSAKILPMSLEDIAINFNIGSKQIVNHNFANKDSIYDISFKNDIIKYCENDALLVVRFLDKIKNSVLGLESLENVYSISGLALNIFKKKFNKYNINTRITKDIDILFRPAYYGGRCEVFGNLKYDECCFHFDFSGMYTNRLLEYFPHGSYTINYNINNITNNGFYYIHVFSNIEIPILPFRDKNKLLFPNGYFHGLYWGEEILLFIKNGGIIRKIEYGIEFNKTEKIFEEFSKFCNISRKKSIYDKILWKLIPNSFIGRLGIKYDEEETIIIKDEDYDPHNYDVICDKKINKNWIVRIKSSFKNENKRYGNVIYPAIVTSKARILWWESSQAVIKNGGRILYCDTDSIFAAFKKDKKPLNQKHGEVFWDTSKKDTCLSDACFATSKVYCISYDNETFFKIKGISKKYIKDFDMISFKKFFEEGNKKIFKTTIFEKKKLNIKITDINKLIDFSYYDKRIFNKDKTETKPLFYKSYPI